MKSIILKAEGPKENFIKTMKSTSFSNKRKIDFFHKTFPKAVLNKGKWVDQSSGTTMEIVKDSGVVFK